MQGARFAGVALCAALGACGGGQQVASPPRAGSGGPGSASDNAVASTSGEPGWITRGSAAVSSDGGRVFYGVGLATGIKNPALLRTTADDRARAELAKVLESFSASLMKDYANSDEQQNVEQAVQTLASMSMQGVQIVDRYTAADGTLYALAALDLATVQGALDKAKASGMVKSTSLPVKVDDLFDKSAKKAAPPPLVLAQGGEAGTPVTGGKADNSGAQTHAGERPAWVDASDNRFPYTTYMCAVGLAAERGAAEDAGYAALARIFSAKVASSSKDFMGAYSKTGAPDLEVQSTETLTKVSTTAVLQGVQIKEVWTDPGKQVYALACLERAKVGQLLRLQISEADQKAATYLSNAASMDKASRIRELSRAMDTILQREADNTQLRLVDANGVGVTGPYTAVDVSAALEAAVEALKVGVKTEGPYDSDFRSALIQGLTSRGYKVNDLAQAMEGEMDVLVSANIRVEDGGVGTGSAASTFFARGVIQVEVKNISQNKILASFSESRKEGSRSKEEAERRAVRNLAGKISAEVGGKIDASMRGK